MKAPPIPFNENERISALHNLSILDTPPEERFDRVTRVAKTMFQVPIALVSLVDTNRQWFKSCIGLDASETSREVSFCGHAILQKQPFIIEDALKDVRFYDNPLVVGGPHIRFYAGIPLAAPSPNNYFFGTLCLIDTKPRKFNSEELAAFKDLAAIVENELNNVDLSLSLQEKNQAKKALVESETRYEAILDTLHEGIIIQEASGQIVDFNPAAEQIFKLTEPATGETGGKALKALPDFTLEDGTSLSFESEAHPAQAVLRNGQAVSNQVIGVCQDNETPRWFLVNSQPLSDGNRQPKNSRVISSFTDITPRKEVEDRYKALASASFEGIAITANHKIIEANQALASIFGYEPDELMAKQLEDLIVPASREEFVKKVYFDNFQLYEVSGIRKDGLEIALEIHTQKVSYKNQDARVVVLRDITHRKELDQAKNQFVSVVSHELRTPLTAIRGSLGLLLGGVGGEISPQVKAMIEIADKNSGRLVRLINDILDIEKLESGKMVFDFMPVELEAVIEQAIEVNQPFARQFGVNFELDKTGRPEKNIRVKADRDRLMQVLTNLLSNSAKFSPPGECVKIAIKPELQTARIEISDRGPGIPKEFESQIFQKFAQADSSDRRQKGGTGLGLSITKAIVEAHGGRVGFMPGQGEVGTVFYFDLPRVA